MRLSVFILFLSLSASASFMPTSFSVNLTESHVSQLNGKTKITKAKIDYQYPGKLKYKNDDLLFTTNGQQSWQFIPTSIPGEKNEVIMSSKNHIISKLFDVLKNGLKTNDLFKVDEKTKSHYMLKFTSKGQSEFRLKSVEFFAYGKSEEKALKDIKRMSLEYIDGKKVNQEFTNFQIMNSFAESHFNFKIPKNTKVMTQ